jgi:hypothetical protein
LLKEARELERKAAALLARNDKKPKKNGRKRIPAGSRPTRTNPAARKAARKKKAPRLVASAKKG